MIFDSLRGLVNSLSGLGSARDKGAIGAWYYSALTPDQLANAYRSNWMCRKAVDIPALDMMRKGWVYDGPEDQIAIIRRAEEQHDIQGKVFRALRLARLYGGAGIIIGDGAEDPQEELVLERIGRGDLRYIAVVPRRRLLSGTINLDMESPYYGQPSYYDIVDGAGHYRSRLHPSRVVRFIGADLLDPEITEADHWGDSVLDAIEIAIRDATATSQAIASLVQEAKLDVIKVPGLTQHISTAAYRDALQARFSLAMQTKSSVNALLLDEKEAYEQKSANFSGLPDTQRLFLQIVSGAADIPATRFLSQSPAGMSATGESDIRNYYDRIQAQQTTDLKPKVDRLVEAVGRSALGSWDDDIRISFPPLWQATEKERAEMEAMHAETLNKYVLGGLVPTEVGEDLARNRLVESESFSGAAAAYDDFDAAMASPNSADQDQLSPLTETGEQGRSAGQAMTADARPRTLYIKRQVLNAADIIAWARSQGFDDELVPEADLHVTIAHSRKPINWMDVPHYGDDEQLVIGPGGPRLVEPLGPNGAIVLLFGACVLSWRHEEIKRIGASWDWPDYQPHITFAVDRDADEADFRQVEPYRGQIVLGPEIFEEVRSD